MTEQATARDLREQVRDWRRGRADINWIEAFMDGYIAVFATIMLGSMAVSVVLGLGEGVRDGCVTDACRAARGVLPIAASLGVLAAAAAVARLFGPVFATPAEASWLLATPVGRGGLVRPRFARLIAAIVGGVALLAAGIGGLAGAGAGAFVLAGLSALAACAVVAATTIGQVRETRSAMVLMWLLALAAWALLVVLALGRAPDLALPALDAWWVGTSLVTGAIAVVAVVLGLRSLPAIRRRSLSHGGRIAPSISGALATLDLALLYDVLVARRWMGVEGVRSRRGGPRGVPSLAHASLIRLLRSPQSLVVLAASMVLPYGAAATGIGIAVAFVAALACFLTGLGLLTGLRVFTRSPSLVRAFPYPNWVLRLMTLSVPGLCIVLAGLATSPAMAGLSANAWLLGLACGVSGLASAVRWVTGKPPDYSRPLVSTPAGGVPTNLYGSALRGFDILVLTVAPMLLWHGGRGVEVSIGLSVLTIAILIGRE